MPTFDSPARSVLILGAEPRIAVTVARSLARRGIVANVAAVSAAEAAVHSRAIKRFFRLPDANHGADAFLAGLLETIRITRADMLMPISDTALAAIGQQYDRISAEVDPGCPRPEVIARVLDKGLTIEAAGRCAIGVPATFDLGAAAARDACRTLAFPVIAKPRNKSVGGSFKIRYYQNAVELIESLDADPNFGRRYVFQEFVPGVGVGIALLVRGGTPLASFMHRRLREYPSAGGVSVLSVGELVDPTLHAKAVALLADIGWEGVALVEFRRAPDGRIWLMEVNGRYWGSIATAVQAGIDFPWLQWQAVHGELPAGAKSYATNLRVRWTAGELARLYELVMERPNDGIPRPTRWSALFEFMADYRPSIRDALWSFSDPRPGFEECVRAIGSHSIKSVKAIIRAILPARLRQLVRSIGPRATIAFMWLSLMRRLGMRRSRLPEGFSTSNPLFVCSGNIMRSAFALALFRHLSGNAAAGNSAGLHAASGKAADPRTVAAAHAIGLDVSTHVSQPLDRNAVAKADAVFVMDRLQEAETFARFPEARSKLYLLGACITPENESVAEIPDPFFMPAGAAPPIFDVVRSSVESMVARSRMRAADTN